MTTHTPTTTASFSSKSSKREENLRFRITQDDFFRGVQIVQSAISQRSTLPILSNILIEVQDGRLRFSATDLEVGIRAWVKSDVIENGEITVPAKILSDFLRTLESDREILFEAKDNSKVDLRAGKDRLSLAALPRADYPVLPEFEEEKSVVLSRKVLRELLKKTSFASSTEETRYVLNGVHVNLEGGRATAVATDGRRLAYIQREAPGGEDAVKVIIPSKAINEVLRMVSEDRGDGDVKVLFTENQTSFFDGETLILSRLIEGHFPNFEQVIPKTHEIQVKLNRAALLASVTRAAVGTLDKGGTIRLSLTQGTLKIQGAAQGRVESESEMAIAYEGGGFEVAFSPVYFTDVLRALDDDDVYLELTSPLNPGVIRPAGEDTYRYIMMPLKI